MSLPRRPPEPELLRLTPPRADVKHAALTGDSPRGVAAPLLASWERSRAQGADPDGAYGLEQWILDERSLLDARGRCEALRRHASSVLGGFAAACSSKGFVALLADAEGVVVDSYAGGAFSDEAKRLRLIAGAAWDEALRGTNAIGTALVENRPVAVHGTAHYARVNEGLVCFAAPIRNSRGQIVGVLDATSSAERTDAFDIGIVVSMARAVEEVLRAREYARSSGGIDLVERLMERSREPAFLVERPCRIVRSNAKGQALTRQIGHQRFLPDWNTLVAHASLQSPLRVDLPGPGRARKHGSPAFPALDLIIEPVNELNGDILALMVFASPAADGERLGMGRSETSLPDRTAGPARAFRRILGSDPALKEARSTCSRLARSRLPVLLLAETGAGKELFARAIHDASPRSAAAYVPLNCGAIQPDLLISELFGHGDGAFTGAARGGRDGLVAAADRGTLFLDEVADLSPEAQVSLLRVLEDGTYFRVGDSVPRRTDIRIVAATSRDLNALVRSGEFREDLYFRIGGACVELPPLRARTDIEELARDLWTKSHGRRGILDQVLSAGALAAISAYHWPGNVRELLSALEFAAAMAEGEAEVAVEHLPASARASRSSARAATATQTGSPAAGLAALDAARRTALIEALEASNGNVSAAARRLGIARSTFYRLARRLGMGEIR